MPNVKKLKQGEVAYVTPYPGRGRPSRERKALRDAEVAAGYLIPEKSPIKVKSVQPKAPEKVSKPLAVEPVEEAARPLQIKQTQIDGYYRTAAKNLAASAIACAKGEGGEGAVLTIANRIAIMIERERVTRVSQ